MLKGTLLQPSGVISLCSFLLSGSLLCKLSLSWFPCILSSVSSTQQDSWTLPGFSLPVPWSGKHSHALEKVSRWSWNTSNWSYILVLIVLHYLMSNVLGTIVSHILFRFFFLPISSRRVNLLVFTLLIKNVNSCRLYYNHFVQIFMVPKFSWNSKMENSTLLYRPKIGEYQRQGKLILLLIP